MFARQRGSIQNSKWRDTTQLEDENKCWQVFIRRAAAVSTSLPLLHVAVQSFSLLVVQIPIGHMLHCLVLHSSCPNAVNMAVAAGREFCNAVQFSKFLGRFFSFFCRVLSNYRWLFCKRCFMITPIYSAIWPNEVTSECSEFIGILPTLIFSPTMHVQRSEQVSPFILFDQQTFQYAHASYIGSYTKIAACRVTLLFELACNADELTGWVL